MKGVHHLAAANVIFKLIHCKFTACAALLHSLPTLAALHLYCKTQETSALDVRLVSNGRDSPTGLCAREWATLLPNPLTN